MPALPKPEYYRAYAWRTGVIGVSRTAPSGAIKLFTFNSCRAAAVGRRLIEASARHAYDGKTLLVPGVPEAGDDETALEALVDWARWVAPKLHAHLPERAFTTEVRA
jgi:hypothetical protein